MIINAGAAFCFGFLAGLVLSALLCIGQISWMNSRIDYWFKEAMKNLQTIIQMEKEQDEKK